MVTYFKLLISLFLSSALPLTVAGCVFNQYANQTRNQIINKIAGQTANVIKSLYLAKIKDADTDATINDLLASGDNYDLTNYSQNQSINNWNDFTHYWGENGQITTKNLNLNQLIIGHGQGSLTKTIQKYQQQQNLFKQLKLSTTISSIGNGLFGSLLYDQGNIRNQVTNFLNSLKSSTSGNDDNFLTTLIKNSIIGNDWAHPAMTPQFENNFIEPLQRLFDVLVDGWWDYREPTPTNIGQLKDFMNSWVDENDIPYSNWVKNGSWSLNSSYYAGWTPQDYEFYRGGVLISHLFYQIGRDNQISKPGSTHQDRYLGDIISNHIKITSLDTDGLMQDLQQYLPKLTTNPRYLFDLIDAMMPILKADILKQNDVTNGIKNLTIGRIYPTNYQKQSINIGTIFTNLLDLLHNKNQIKQIVTDMLLGTKGSTHQAFLTDIRVSALGGFVIAPISTLLNSFAKQTATDLANTVADFLTSSQVIDTVSQIATVYHSWVNFYDQSSRGFNFDLNQVITFLFGAGNDPTLGILNLFNQEVVKKPGENGWYDIITSPDVVTDYQYQVFFEGLGGQIPVDGTYPNNFRPNSILNLLQTAAADTAHPINLLLTVLFGDIDGREHGILDELIDEQNQFITNNYTKYFDETNHSISHLSNISNVTKVDNMTNSNILSYNLSYRVDNQQYLFFIKGVFHEKLDNNPGNINFHFLEINRIV